jgi:hypothetical protein
MDSKYMKAISIPDEIGEKAWEIHSKRGDDLLGWIQYYEPWKQFVLSPETGTIFSTGCLQDIITFIDQIKDDKK